MSAWCMTTRQFAAVAKAVKNDWKHKKNIRRGKFNNDNEVQKVVYELFLDKTEKGCTYYRNKGMCVKK